MGMLLGSLLGHPQTRRAVGSVFRQWSQRRIERLDRMNAGELQRRILARLVRKARSTRFGQDHGFSRIRSIADYQSAVPLRRYEDFWRDYWQPTFPHSFDATWPDAVRYVALSSGTTTGKTKYIPLTDEILKSHQRGALTSLARLQTFDPQFTPFSGKMFFLGGSTGLESVGNGPLMGDLSGVVNREAKDWVRPFTFPSPELSLLNDWDVKLDRLAAASINQPITLVSGVPSWLLVLFDRVRQLTGRDTLREVWPTLQVVVHGGTSFEPYRRLFRKVIGDDSVRLIETYPASEGFIASDDPRYEMLRLIPDNDIFFEFVPSQELFSARPTRHTIDQVEPGINYGVVLTTTAGLWSYILGDTVTFESSERLLLRFSGRVDHFLSAFGEHVIGEEVDRSIERAALVTDAAVADFHVGPVFPSSTEKVGFHRYYIEFVREPESLDRFRDVLDQHLSAINDDYRAHRLGDLTMGPPEVLTLPRGTFADWMKSRGKLGGQNKVPRLDNTGRIGEQLGNWMETVADHDLSRFG